MEKVESSIVIASVIRAGPPLPLASPTETDSSMAITIGVGEQAVQGLPSRPQAQVLPVAHMS